MPMFSIAVPVLDARGAQYYEVEAADEADALETFKRGEVTFVHEELEVQQLGTPEIELDS